MPASAKGLSALAVMPMASVTSQHSRTVLCVHVQASCMIAAFFSALTVVSARLHSTANAV